MDNTGSLPSVQSKSAGSCANNQPVVFFSVSFFAIGSISNLPLDTAAHYGGEAGRHYPELKAAEEATLTLLEQSFGTVVIILNSTNAMELGFLEDENVDAALWSECYGSVGTLALGGDSQRRGEPLGQDCRHLRL